MNETLEIDRYVASLAPVRDKELVDAAGSAEARFLLTDILDTAPVRWRPPRRASRRAFAAATGLAGAAAAVAAVALALGGGDARDAAAAVVLRRAAHAAARQQQLVPGPGQYLYTKSVDAFLDTAVVDGTSFSAIIPHVRETWLGPGGGRLHESSGAPVFLSAKDRRAWIAAGRPRLGHVPGDEVALPPAKPLDLPTDPNALYERLEVEARGHGTSLHTEMFVLVGDALRETVATPAQKAALYAVAARIPGVQLIGTMTDRAGRRGTAVAIDDTANRERDVLVLDPRTGALLDEEELLLAGNWGNYPAGTRIGWASYLEQAVVDSATARPSH